MIRAAIFATLLAPAAALAAGGGSSSAPEPTPTTKTCKNGKVWDSGSKSCVDASHSALDDDELYDAVREFAYAGQYLAAQNALAEMSDQSQDRVLTYWGFTHRKLGDMSKGMAYYRQAIDANPGNILARSYMGQALVLQEDMVGAYKQLQEIRKHGGQGTWAEASLSAALESGQTYSY